VSERWPHAGSRNIQNREQTPHATTTTRSLDTFIQYTTLELKRHDDQKQHHKKTNRTKQQSLVFIIMIFSKPSMLITTLITTYPPLLLVHRYQR